MFGTVVEKFARWKLFLKIMTYIKSQVVKPGTSLLYYVVGAFKLLFFPS